LPHAAAMSALPLQQTAAAAAAAAATAAGAAMLGLLESQGLLGAAAVAAQQPLRL
jgi:hypothetical protein